MSLAATLDVLRPMRLFQHLDDPRLRIVAMTGERLSLSDGERLAEQGEEGDAAFIVLDGAVDIRVPGEAGEISVAILGPGEIVGEMAVLTGNPRSTAIVAKGPLKVLRLGRDAVLGLIREFPDVSLEIIRILAERLEATNARVA